MAPRRLLGNPMINDDRTIEEFFTGYLEVVKDGEYNFLYRFGMKQRAFYEKEGEFYGMQSRFAAGIVLSASECEKISFDIICKSAEKYSLSVIHDGIEEERVFEKAKNHLELAFHKEDVSLYFPHGAEIGVRNIEVIGNCCKASRNILSFGDSITQGYLITEPAAAYTAVLGRQFHANVYNFGVSGYFIRKGILNELDVMPKPFMVTFAYGTNDWHFEKDYTADLPEVFAKLHEKFSDVPIFVILPIARMDEKTVVNKLGTLTQVREAIAAEAARYNHFYVLRCGNQIDPSADLCPDGIHPHSDGMRKLGRCLTKEIRADLQLSL